MNDTYIIGKIQKNLFSRHSTLEFNKKGIILSDYKLNGKEPTYWEKTDNKIKIKDGSYNLIIELESVENNHTELFIGQLKNDKFFIYKAKEEQPSIKILVASNVDYVKKSGMLDELKSKGITEEEFCVVLSGADNEDNKGNTFYTKTNHWEYSTLLRASSIPNPPDYWLMIHDTCLLGNKFKDLYKKVDLSLPFDMVSVNRMNSFNMGYYRKEFLSYPYIKDYLEAIKLMSREKGIFVELNAEIRKKASLASTIEEDIILKSSLVIPWGENPRRQAYIPKLDLYKYYYDALGNHPGKP